MSKNLILLVDDEPQIHTVLTKMLTNENFEVLNAFNAEEAYQHIARRKPDLILLDIMMPKVSGIEVCNKIKADPETQDIVIVMLSARDAQSDRIEGLTHGADDYV